MAQSESRSCNRALSCPRRPPAHSREDSCIKLIDFSLASFFYSPTDPGGTPDFVAPEMLNQPEYYAKVRTARP